MHGVVQSSSRWCGAHKVHSVVRVKGERAPRRGAAAADAAAAALRQLWRAVVRIQLRRLVVRVLGWLPAPLGLAWRGRCLLVLLHLRLLLPLLPLLPLLLPLLPLLLLQLQQLLLLLLLAGLLLLLLLLALHARLVVLQRGVEVCKTR